MSMDEWERETYQFLKDASVQDPFSPPALVHLVVVLLQARPVVTELLEAVLVDVVQPVERRRVLAQIPQPDPT